MGTTSPAIFLTISWLLVLKPSSPPPPLPSGAHPPLTLTSEPVGAGSSGSCSSPTSCTTCPTVPLLPW